MDKQSSKEKLRELEFTISSLEKEKKSNVQNSTKRNTSKVWR
jgi:hypothetical protein